MDQQGKYGPRAPISKSEGMARSRADGAKGRKWMPFDLFLINECWSVNQWGDFAYMGEGSPNLSLFPLRITYIYLLWRQRWQFALLRSILYDSIHTGDRPRGGFGFG